MNSEIGKIAGLTQEIRIEESPLQKQLRGPGIHFSWNDPQETLVEAFLRFETKVGRGEALLRLRRDDKAKARAAALAWSLLTALD